MNRSAGYSGRCHAYRSALDDQPWSEFVESFHPSDSDCVSGGAQPGCWWTEIGDGKVPEGLPVSDNLCNYDPPNRPWWLSAEANIARASRAEGASEGDARWGYFSWSTPYITTSDQYVMSVIAPVFEDQTAWNVSMMCGVDLDFDVMSRAMRAYLADRDAARTSHLLLINQEGKVLVANGPGMENVPYTEMAQMNALDGSDMDRHVDLSHAVPAMRKRFGARLPAKGDPSWKPGNQTTKVLSWFEGGQFFSVAPLEASLDGGKDCYVVLLSPPSTYRVGLDSATVRTVVIGLVIGLLTILVEGVTLVEAEVKEAVRWFTSFRIGPHTFRYHRVVGLWLVIAGFAATFGVWLAYTEEQVSGIVRDGAVGFGNLVFVRTAAFLFGPRLLTALNAVPFQTGMLQPVPSTPPDYDKLDTYLSTQLSIFDASRFVGVATRNSYHGMHRLKGEGADPANMETASVDPQQTPGQWLYAPLDRKSATVVGRNLSATPPKGPTGVVIGDTAWYQAAASNTTTSWSRAYTFTADGSAGVTAVRAVPPSRQQAGAPLGVVVEVSPDVDDVSRFLSSSTQGSEFSRIFVVEREVDGKLVGASHGDAAITKEGVSRLREPTQSADPTSTYLARALLTRFGSLDKVPCPVWQGVVGEETPDSTEQGQFYVSYQCIDGANWGVVAAYRSDRLLRSQRIALRQSIVLVVGLVGLIFGSLECVKQLMTQRRDAMGQSEGEDASEHIIISNDEVAAAAEADVLAEKGRLMTRLRTLIRTNMRAVYGDPSDGVDLVEIAAR